MNIARSLCVLVAAGLVGMSAYAADAEQAAGLVKSEKYAWKSVTIKGNGFIDGVVFSQAQPGVLFMHTDMGGAYRYDIPTSQWVCLTDFIPWNDSSLANMGVETLACDPSDANRVYMAVGTYMGKSAIFRSSDQGRTWQRTDVAFTMNGNGNARNCGERMNVDPNLGSILLYGTRNKGLWKSTDYGATWNPVASFPTIGDTSGGARDAGIVWTLFDKTSGTRGSATKTIYAGVMTLGKDKVFRSADAGATWSPVPGQPNENLLPTRVALAPDGKLMYLTYIVGQGGVGPFGAVGGGVYRVENPAGDSPTWTDISPSKGKFGWSGVCIERDNPQSLLVSVLNRYNPTDDIYRSTDGGKTWRGLDINEHRDDSSAAYAKHMSTHWVGDVQIDPFDPNHALYTTGYGLYNTTNATAEKPTWQFFNEGFEQTAVLEMVSPPTGSANLLSAIGDRDGYRHEDFTISPVHGGFGEEQSLNGQPRMSMGSCRQIAVAWDDPNVVVRVGQRPQYSLDGGITWAWFEGIAAPQIPTSRPATRSTTGPATRRGGFGGFGPRAMSSVAISTDGNTVLLSNASGTSFATRKGNGWSEWTKGANGPVGGSVMADLANAKHFYARAGNSFYQSTDAGATWTLQTSNAPQFNGWIRPAIGHEGHLWGCVRDVGLLCSTDGGKTWTKVMNGGLEVVNQVGVGAAAPGSDYPAIFIGGSVSGVPGFFRSDDQGATWVRINDDQHQYGYVTVIQGDSRVFGRLYVGTNGRGIQYGERQ